MKTVSMIVLVHSAVHRKIGNFCFHRTNWTGRKRIHAEYDSEINHVRKTLGEMEMG